MLTSYETSVLEEAPRPLPRIGPNGDVVVRRPAGEVMVARDEEGEVQGDRRSAAIRLVEVMQALAYHGWNSS